MEPMKPMRPMEPMKGMEPMRPMEPMKPMEPVQPWWPADLGSPNASGGQNDVRYAYFGEKRRLIVEKGGRSLTFDTADHEITGIQQSQGDLSRLVFASQHGPVALTSLKRVDG